MASRVAVVDAPPPRKPNVPGNPAKVAQILQARSSRKAAAGNGAAAHAPKHRGRPETQQPSMHPAAVRARARRAAAKAAAIAPPPPPPPPAPTAPAPPPPIDESTQLTPASLALEEAAAPATTASSSESQPGHAPEIRQRATKHVAGFIKFLGFVAALWLKDDDMRVPEKDAAEVAELTIEAWPELLDELDDAAKFTAVMALGSLVAERVGKHQRNVGRGLQLVRDVPAPAPPPPPPPAPRAKEATILPVL